MREVSQVPPGIRVELLGIKAEGRGDPEQPLHQVTCSLQLSDDRERRHKPERADQERSLLTGEAVVGLIGAVTQDEAVLGQLLGDCENSIPQAFVVMCEKLEAPRQQCRGIECVRLVVLAQHASVADAVCKDVGPDLIRRCAPCRCQLRVASDLRQRARSVQSDPAH